MAGKPFSSDTIEIHFDGKKCIHARKCVLVLPQVFQPGAKGGWIKPEGASAEDIAAMARTCPSGAITYTRKDDQPNEQPPTRNTITMRENGQLDVNADIYLKGEHIGYRAVLCRCGLSENKPFCDGSHVKGKFEASGERAMRDNEELESVNGRLDITPSENGSLKVEGNVEICCGSGRSIQTKTKVFLCRCGQSKNKPFCDGSHKAAGFKAPA